MFVPIDRLYLFLDQFTNDDVIIYRFYPHGSKNFSDITMLRDYPRLQNWLNGMESVPMLMYDQEPLNFDLYQDIESSEILRFLQKNNATIDIFEKHNLLNDVIKIYKTNNLFAFSRHHVSDYWLLCHSEKNSSELTKYESLGAVGVYWWSHAIISRDWYRYGLSDQRLNYFGINFDKDFNVYNRAWTGTREYRLKFTEMIIKNDLLPTTSTTLSEYNNELHYRNYVFKNPKFSVDTDFSIVKPNQTTSTASADYSFEDYQRSAIDVVLETIFDDNRIHLTEKTLRPIACGKPFIIVSTPGCLQYLRDYGFETFKDYIDESYDNILDPLDRLECIIKLMADISSLPKNQKNKLYQQLHKVANRNKKWFWSNTFAQKIVNEFKENYAKSYNVCKKSQTGQEWLRQRKILASLSDDYRKWLCSDNEYRSRRDIATILMKIKKSSI